MPAPRLYQEVDPDAFNARRSGLRTDVRMITLYALPRRKRGSAFDAEDYPEDRMKTFPYPGRAYFGAR